MEKPVINFSDRTPIEKRVETLEREVYLLKHRIRVLEEKVRKLGAVEELEDEREVLLSHIDATNPRVVEIIMDWITFMLSRVGEEEIEDLLEYYRSVGWINKEVKDLLLKYARGLRVENVKGYVDPSDHIKSLEYINRIREAMS